MGAGADIHELEAGADAAGARLDRWLADAIPALSRSRVKALVEAGQLTLDGAVLADPAAKVIAGGRYVLSVPPPAPAIPKPESIPLSILYEDEHLIVVDKPAGMAVHPAAGNWTGTLVHALLHHCAGSLSGVGGVERPGIVHRLDKDTSGVLIAAKTDAAHQALSAQFAAHSAERVYIAFVRGAPQPREGRIETRLARSPHDRKKMAVVKNPHSTAGKIAVTNYRVIKGYGKGGAKPLLGLIASMVECRLETGRTHQIRAHMAHIGCPLLGDPVYGKGRGAALAKLEGGKEFKDFRRQALHAAVLGFDHPATGERLRFETPLPKDLQRLEAFLETL
ncbi:MAG: RluA family pseudouridine synthase [Maricaulaceae bacterium]|nr:RluA family pseudouridine synthase [Maricaulaceae bacterium]